MNNQFVSHEGEVQRVDGERVSVLIRQASACSGCAARQMCSSAESREKVIVADNLYKHPLAAGQQVVVKGAILTARKAVMIAYVFPLLLVLLALFLTYWLTANELLTALSSLVALAVAFLIIYSSAGKISNELVFVVEPLLTEPSAAEIHQTLN